MRSLRAREGAREVAGGGDVDVNNRNESSSHPTRGKNAAGSQATKRSNV